jgi:hypothetical protein
MYTEKILAWFQALQSTSWWPIAMTALASIACLLVLFGLVNRSREFLQKRRVRKLNRGLVCATKVASFTEQQIADAIRNYVEPDCSPIDPHSESDPVKLATARTKAFRNIDELVNKDGLNHHLLVLAEAGMGKSTLCLSFYAREQGKPPAKRKPVAVIPLGRPDALQQISAVERKNETILFLDALDEDSAAIEDSDAQLQKLMEAAEDFKAVIVTCRSQFFLADGPDPKPTEISAVPKKTGQAGSLKFQILHLFPLTASQIVQHLRLQFPWHQSWKRKKAMEMMSRIPELGERPMLLPLLPDLLKKRRKITELFELYAFMVNRWVAHECRWMASKKLTALAKLLAVEIYTNPRQTQLERVSADELQALAKTISADIEGSHLRSGTLLKRDSEGNLKFSHRSVMEFLFISAFIDGDERCKDVEWTDGMRSFFISWGRSKDGVASANRVREILSQDLRKTGLLPLSGAIGSPRIFSSTDKLKRDVQVRKRRSLPMPFLWRIESLRFSSNSEVMHVYDFTYDLKWKIVLTHGMESYEERKLYRYPLSSFWMRDSDATPEPVKKNNQERLPSVDELISLWEAETVLKDQKIFDRREFYWLGDKPEGYTYLACSFGQKPITNELASSSSSVALRASIALHANGKQETLYIYEAMLRAGPGNAAQFSAQMCMLEFGATEAAWYEKSHMPETECSI